ncbi:MAG TPA: carboxypeptidase regulatory-like domain-containing protein, partial [Longimicrobium sp.]|nr:carboxypeptidase regulatory-like domain-containing protein [Longimicrobium sp.]
MSRTLAALLAVLCALAAPLSAQEPARVIRGTVVDGAGAGVGGAEVRVTHVRSRAEARATADSAGRFTANAPGDGGAYQVLVSVSGRPAAQSRVTFAAGQREAEVRVTVGSGGRVRLDTLTVATRRRQAPRGQRMGDREGVLDGRAEVAPGSITPGSEGSLDALAGLVPGVQMTPQGPSVFGLGAEQNSRTLNGLNVGDVDLPRDMRSSLQVATSPWDPTRGGFSGAQLAATIAPGGTFNSRSASLVIDAPVQRLTDPALARLGGQGPRTVFGAGGSGELVPGRYYYNAGFSATVARSGSSTLLSSDRDALRLSGIHPDSATRLVGTLRDAGVALDPGGLGGRLQDAASLTVRLDRDPNGTNRANLLAFGKVEHSDALRQTPRATPGYTGEAWNVSTGLSLASSHYLWTNYLHEPMLGATWARRRGSPHLALPGGRVLLSSDLGGGQPVLTPVSFGGNSLEEFRFSDWTIQFRDELTWLSRDATLRRKLFVESVLAGFANETAANRLGSYDYRSLADVVENRPYSFRRQFGSTEASGRQWSGALAWADSRRMFKSLQLTYGARVEANRFLDAPEDNPALREAFGVRTDRLPNRVSVSPRLGFTWSYRPTRMSMMSSSLGTASFWRGGMVQGGIGKFRNALPATLLDDALRGTGLPGGLRELTCLGSAVPAPDWRTFLDHPSAIPERCAGEGGTLTDISPRAQLFGRDYDAPHSWRASLGWSTSFGKVSFGVDGSRSWNRSVGSRRDLNFGGEPRFVLASEGGRPVFVSPASIEPGTGATSATEARIRRELGRVDQRVSDLRSSSWQLSGRVTPDVGAWRRLSLSYTMAGARGESRGFDGAAFGDPRVVETADGSVARHQFLLHGGIRVKWVSVSLFGRLVSGLPFTPAVAGDVNGDGLGLDRAFVFDPAAVSDPVLASGMEGVLREVPGYARRCLASQLGRAAA